MINRPNTRRNHPPPLSPFPFVSVFRQNPGHETSDEREMEEGVGDTLIGSRAEVAAGGSLVSAAHPVYLAGYNVWPSQVRRGPVGGFG